MAGVLVASLASGCFALFSLDEYGPAEARDATDGGGDADATARDATAADASAPGRTVFVTRETFSGDVGGLDGGDDKCQRVAVDAGLEGTFRAWLGDSRNGTLERFVLDAGPLRLTNGTLVAASTLDLAARGPQSAIVVDQRGEMVTLGGGCGDGGLVAWTGTLPDGGSAGSLDCARWRSGAAPGTGNAGLVGGPAGTWTMACVRGCQTAAALYCIAQ